MGIGLEIVLTSRGIPIRMTPTRTSAVGLGGGVAGPTIQPRVDEYSRRLARRYEDGYRMGRAIIVAGRLIKIGALAAGLAVVVAATAAADSVGAFRGNSGILALLLAVLAGAFSCLFTWACGAAIGAIGQQAIATLDTALNTSPFLDNEQRSAIMNLD
jgi:hypothetical protein